MDLGAENPGVRALSLPTPFPNPHSPPRAREDPGVWALPPSLTLLPFWGEEKNPGVWAPSTLCCVASQPPPRVGKRTQTSRLTPHSHPRFEKTPGIWAFLPAPILCLPLGSTPRPPAFQILRRTQASGLPAQPLLSTPSPREPRCPGSLPTPLLCPPPDQTPVPGLNRTQVSKLPVPHLGPRGPRCPGPT